MRGDDFMKKESKKILLVLLVILIIIVLFFIINTIRKISILGDLENKVISLNARDNIYSKMESNYEISEMYKKDNIVKISLTKKDTNDNQVVLGNTETYKNIIVNYAEHLNFFEKLKSGITSSISKEEIDGKICYVISDKGNINWSVPTDCENMKVYVEKETGLPIKHIVDYKDREEIYEYAFGIVKDADIQE